MVEITNAVKGGLPTTTAAKMFNDKIDEMWQVKDVEEHDQMWTECENFDEENENYGESLEKLEKAASTMNVINYVVSEELQGISKVDCGAPKSCANEEYIEGYKKNSKN